MKKRISGTTIFWFIVLLCFLVIFINEYDFNERDYPDTPPPDYKIVCNLEGYYGVKMYYGTIIDKGYDENPFETYYDAVKRAWKQYYYSIGRKRKQLLKEKNKNNIIWYDCDSTKEKNHER